MNTPANSIPAATDRPVLRDDVHLLGRVKETGFTDSQWLIDAGGRFIQVSGLVYKLAEKCNGTRTVDEIADELSEESPFLVRCDQVDFLLNDRLAPAGLLSSEEASDTPKRQMADPLRLQARAQALNEERVAALGNAFQVLYHPLNLLPLVVVLVALHAWFYFNFQPGQSIENMLLVPGLLLASMVLMLLAAIFHEIGHAAALHYSGGSARSMGFGFLLVYPAFFTDVTDSYRLGRLGRLRTDLGGIYFHLLFAGLAIALLLAGVRSDLLVATIFLINLDAARQLLPFYRLDGYWILADAAGLNDFLTQAPGFVRSLLPWSKTKLRLKPVAKFVFSAYLLIATPLLIGMLLYFVWQSPFIVESLWSSLVRYSEGTISALETSRWLSATAFAAAASFVVLFLIGMGLMGLRLITGVGTLLVSGISRPKTRIPVMFLTVAIALSLSIWWLPRLQDAFAGDEGLPARAERYSIATSEHVLGPVDYVHSPPVGGRHHPEPLPCGFYESPVPNERAVHTLEHGAVWIAYSPNLNQAEVEELRAYAEQNDKTLISLYPGVESGLVLSAWGVQMPAESVNHPDVGKFFEALAANPTAPESGLGC